MKSGYYNRTKVSGNFTLNIVRGCPWKTSAVRGKGFLRCGHPHFLEQKLLIFQNLRCVRSDKGGWASAGILWTRGDQFFAIFCGHLLWTAS